MDKLFLPCADQKDKNSAEPPLPQDTDVLLQLTEGLNYIHEKGFVHGNIKPENVLISWNPQQQDNRRPIATFKWADFGLYKFESNRMMTRGRDKWVEQQLWVAPEILKLMRDNENPEECLFSRTNAAADIWSTGCVFFCYLTQGKHPLEGLNDKNTCGNYTRLDVTELIAVIINANFHFFTEFSWMALEKYKSIIFNMMHKSPDRRIQLKTIIQRLQKENMVHAYR